MTDHNVLDVNDSEFDRKYHRRALQRCEDMVKWVQDIMKAARGNIEPDYKAWLRALQNENQTEAKLHAFSLKRMNMGDEPWPVYWESDNKVYRQLRNALEEYK